GVHFGAQPFFPAISDPDHPFFDEHPRRVLAGEMLRSPYFPRGFSVYRRPTGYAKGWAAVVPNRRPGAWADYYVEAPADDLSFERKRAARLGGNLLWRKEHNRLPDDDPLDRLATSAAIEAV